MQSLDYPLRLDQKSAFCLFREAMLVMPIFGRCASPVVLRVFRRQIGLEHFLAGVLASFGPYSASFLLPSSLYSMAAICPWLIVAVIHGTAGRHRWRWAAIVAIIVSVVFLARRRVAFVGPLVGSLAVVGLFLLGSWLVRLAVPGA